MVYTGNIIEKLKRGETFEERHFNPYLKEALEYENILLTTSELKDSSKLGAFYQHPTTVLEIGCYLGKNLIEMASANPATHYLGLDITYKRVVKTARRIRKNNLENAFVGICDGADLLTFLPDASLDVVCVFFPDPWGKDKQKKHRLLNANFFKILKSKLKPTGFFWFKTDHVNYYEETASFAHDEGFLSTTQNPQPTLIAGGPYQTAFEKLFLEKKVPTYEITFFQDQESSKRF